jgi:hypothetical protein
MSTEKARWAKLAGLPKTIDKQQLDENFIGHQMVGNIFDRKKKSMKMHSNTSYQKDMKKKKI